MTVPTHQIRHVVLALAFALAPHVASAQAGSGAQLIVRSPLYEGECVLSIEFAPRVSAKQLPTGLEVQVNERPLDMKRARWPKPADFDGTLLTLALADGFKKGDRVQARFGPNGSWKAVEVRESPLPVSCKQPSQRGSQDERQRLSSWVRIGASSETFAPEIGKFQASFKTSDAAPAPESSTSHLQLLTEFTLDYRLTSKESRALWFLARARYAAQQTSICTTQTASGSDVSGEAICHQDDGTFSANQAFKNVQNARVAEFTLGARYEFATLNADDSPANLYATVTGGSLFAVGVDDKQLNDIFVGVGFVVTRGRLRDTYVESGAGMSEIFSPDNLKFNRWKTNAMLVTDGSALKLWNPIRFFIRFSLDRASGPDSFRTSYGGIVDLSRVFAGL